MPNVIIKKSTINNKGIFANRYFKKGDLVIKWKPKVISIQEFNTLVKKHNIYLTKQDGKCFLMQPPEKHMNHSCDPNTKAINNSDVAIKNIKIGEEITSNYLNSSPIDPFQCNCGSKKCRGRL